MCTSKQLSGVAGRMRVAIPAAIVYLNSSHCTMMQVFCFLCRQCSCVASVLGAPDAGDCGCRVLRDRQWRSRAPSWSMGCRTGCCLWGVVVWLRAQCFSLRARLAAMQVSCRLLYLALLRAAWVVWWCECVLAATCRDTSVRLSAQALRRWCDGLHVFYSWCAAHKAELGLRSQA